MQERYIDTLLNTLLSPDTLDDMVFPALRWQWDGEGDIKEFTKFIADLSFPEDIMRSFVSRLVATRYRYYDGYIEELDTFFRNPLFTSQGYYDYYESIGKLWFIDKRDEGKKELVNNYDNLSIDSKDRIVDSLLNKEFIYSEYFISRDGILMYTEGMVGLYDDAETIRKRYDINNERFLEDMTGGYSILNSSPDRSYFGATSYHEEMGYWDKLHILDSSFEPIAEFESREAYNESTHHWLSNNLVTYLGFTGRRTYNVTTGEFEEEPGPAVRDSMVIERYRSSSNMWSLGDETYSTLEWKMDLDYLLEKPVYTIRSIEGDNKILELELEHHFIGSCENFVYQLETVELGFYVFTATCKVTGELTELPFYGVQK